jgi:hypothetical protein
MVGQIPKFGPGCGRQPMTPQGHGLRHWDQWQKCDRKPAWPPPFGALSISQRLEYPQRASTGFYTYGYIADPLRASGAQTRSHPAGSPV